MGYRTYTSLPYALDIFVLIIHSLFVYDLRSKNPACLITNVTRPGAMSSSVLGASAGGGGGGGGSSGVASGGVGGGGGGPPCGACKFLRRKCVTGCIFAPYFDSEQGAAHFAAVHKVFGASNVSKLLLQIPPHKRLDAVVTVCYEAQARIRDPVYGCVSHVFALQQQVCMQRVNVVLASTSTCHHRHITMVLSDLSSFGGSFVIQDAWADGS
jgi:hypothetical protein